MKLKKKTGLRQRSYWLPSDWAEDRRFCQPFLDGVYETWRQVSGRGTCLLELGRQLV